MYLSYSSIFLAAVEGPRLMPCQTTDAPTTSHREMPKASIRKPSERALPQHMLTVLVDPASESRSFNAVLRGIVLQSGR